MKSISEEELLAEGAHPDGNSPGEKQRGYITPRLNAA
jgi:hypothetical protein